MANHYEIPKWAGKPPVGLHLDVAKGDKLIQKLMIDEKKCYLFGRNPQLNDFCIDHASCSRVHSSLVYHKHLNMAFLVDLGSTHGTFIGNIRLESLKPTQLPVNSTFHFGASTRMYTLRERPQTAPKPVMEELERMTEDSDGGLLGLPETETELDNLTEFNTAHNRRISMLGIGEDDPKQRGLKRHKFNVSFKDEEDVINPEDVDPSVGRFRNLVQTTVVPSKKRRLDISGLVSNSVARDADGSVKNQMPFPRSDGLYGDLPPEQHGHGGSHHSMFSSLLSSKLGMPLPNPAPEVELAPPEPVAPEKPSHIQVSVDPDEPKKKKYAKEAWPGKKPTPSLLV
ncbi:nuclear inhibitor of protein phosphatase 1-like [Portunus trituberculatus]|uniref:nuclear inhibitor of protein phosphatase 1-like n=1 Tax=Portunus trituberculatus TaxID=210409 RepID=UPI001E1CF330|nr:nuclear inhibitor of protein phosphatase 1-like [Portunus trituberculatus]